MNNTENNLIDGMNVDMVRSLMETLPVELSIIDKNDKVVGWNKHHDRLFKRPEACYGMDFRECHGPKSLPLVEKIVSEMKQGSRNKARFWIDAPLPNGEKQKILIEFFALRDSSGNYLGCMECAQDIESIRHLSGEKKLIDGLEE